METESTEKEIVIGVQENGDYVVELTNHNGITIGGDKLQYITLHEPDAYQLKNDSLLQINNGNMAALKSLLPKITEPTLTPQMIDKLKLSDVNRLMGGVLSFLYT